MSRQRRENRIRELWKSFYDADNAWRNTMIIASLIGSSLGIGTYFFLDTGLQGIAGDYAPPIAIGGGLLAFIITVGLGAVIAEPHKLNYDAAADEGEQLSEGESKKYRRANN